MAHVKRPFLLPPTLCRTLTRAAAEANIKTRKGESDALFVILLVVEELKSSNEDIKASNLELKTELADIRLD